MKPKSRKLPLTEKRLAANRANAQKSTGPTTPEGKARAGRNALTHGLLSRVTVIRHGPLREDPAAFEKMLAGLHADLAPRTRMQRLLVDRIASLYWRLRRAQRFESAALHHPPTLVGCDPSAARQARRIAEERLVVQQNNLDRARRALEALQSEPNLTDRDAFARFAPALMDASPRDLSSLVSATLADDPYERWLKAINAQSIKPEDLRPEFLQFASNRIARLEHECAATAAHIASARDAEEEEDRRRRALRALPEDADLRRLVRYESMLDRQLNRAINQYRRLRNLARSPRPRNRRNTGKNPGSSP